MNRKTNLIPALLLSALSLYAMEDVKVTQFQHAGPFTVNKPILADSLNVNGKPFEAKNLLKATLPFEQTLDYMVKPFDFRELDARIKVLLKRRLPGIPETQLTELVYADLRIDRQTKTVYRQEREIKLSPKEYNLLLYMAENPERLLTRVEIADKVWNTHFDTGTNFIDVYINYLRKKIDRDYDVKLIHTKPGMGFIFRQEL